MEQQASYCESVTEACSPSSPFASLLPNCAHLESSRALYVAGTVLVGGLLLLNAVSLLLSLTAGSLSSKRSSPQLARQLVSHWSYRLVSLVLALCGIAVLTAAAAYSPHSRSGLWDEFESICGAWDGCIATSSDRRGISFTVLVTALSLLTVATVLWTVASSSQQRTTTKNSQSRQHASTPFHDYDSGEQEMA